VGESFLQLGLLGGMKEVYVNLKSTQTDMAPWSNINCAKKG